MFRNKVVITFFSVLLFICGLFLLYTSNINKTLFVDVSAEHPFIIENNQEKGMLIKKNSEDNYTVLLPSNFFYQAHTIRLKNTDNKSINFKLYTEQKKDGEKNVEFSIKINVIKINGQNYNDKKQTVWYERPYIDTVSVNKDEVVSLTIKYKTKLMLRNTFIPQLILSIVLFLVSIFLLWNSGVIIKIFQTICLHIEKYGEWDMLIIQKYRDIDVVYKKTFWAVFIVLNLVFLYYNIHFIWGNHDWYYVLHGMWGQISWWNGRFTNYLPYQLLGGRFLPLITVSFALFGYSFTGILLAHYWKVQKTFFNYFVISLIIVLNPLVVDWLYYSIDVVSHLWLPSIMISALILSERKSFYSFIIAYLLFIFGLGIYASGIVTIMTVFLGKIIISYSFEKQSIMFLYKNYKRTFCCIILSIISFRIIISILTMLALFDTSSYNTQMNLFGGTFDNFLQIIKNSYKYLTYSIPFYDNKIIGIMIGFSIFSFILLCWYPKKYHAIKFFQLCFIILGIMLFPLATNLTEFIYGDEYFGGRILFYGYIFLGAFWIVIILKTNFIWAKNILIVFLIFLLPMNVYRLVEAQKLWKIEFDYQNRAIEKIVQKLQDSSYYMHNQGVILVSFGMVRQHIRSFYQEKFDVLDTFINYSSLNFPALIECINFFDAQLKINGMANFTKTKYSSTIKNMTESECLQMLLPYYSILKNELGAWPAGKSILVKDNYVFINYDSEVLQKVIEALEEKQKVINENE